MTPRPRKIRNAQPLDVFLDQLSHEEQLQWWGCQDDPYRYEGMAYRADKSTPLHRHEIKTDGRGNLLSVARPVASACFGQVIPYVRYHNYVHGYNKLTKKAYESRCFGCKAKPACSYVVGERLKRIPGVEQLILSSKNVDNGFRSSSSHGFRRALEKQGAFYDANRELVRLHRAERAEGERAEDARRKRYERKRGLGSGIVAPEYIGAAIRERDRRYRALLDARKDGSSPRSLTRMPPSSCEFVADVWLCEWLHKWAPRRLRDSEVADWLIAHHRHQWQDRASLQGRVATDRRRVTTFEDGEPPLWFAFDPEAAIAAGEVVHPGLLSL